MTPTRHQRGRGGRLFPRFLLALALWLAPVASAFAVDIAALLPNGEQLFSDANGVPLALGSVYFYVPTTSTFKTTWVDPNEAVQNTNPVVLNASGRAVIYGAGSYRQVVKDVNGNTIWDRLTAYNVPTSNLIWGGTSAGSANAQTITAAGYTATAGQQVAFLAGFTNTGPLTLNAQAVGAVAVLKPSFAGAVALTGNEVVAGVLQVAEFDGTQFQLVSSNQITTGPVTSLAGATTTDLGTVPSHNVSITGSATVTSFGSSAATSWSIYYLTFTGTSTLTYNATSLILPGAATKTTAAGDTAVAAYLGSGNWRILSYQTAAAQTVSGLAPQGRLTLTTASPVMTADVTTSGVVYYTSYIGNAVPVWDGTVMAAQTFSEQTLTLNNPNHAANSNYDAYEAMNAGVLTLCTGPVWTSDTSRGTGAGSTELVRKLGLWTNANSMTCRNGSTTFSVAVNFGTYVGTFRTSGTVADTVWVANPAAAAGGGNARLYVWNAYNRVLATAMSMDSTNSWTYTTLTWRAADASNSNRINAVFGLSEDASILSYAGFHSIGNSAAGRYGYLGVGLDSTSAISGAPAQGNPSAGTDIYWLSASYSGIWGLGLHFGQALEQAVAADTHTFYGDNGAPTVTQMVLTFQGRF